MSFNPGGEASASQTAAVRSRHASSGGATNKQKQRGRVRKTVRGCGIVHYDEQPEQPPGPVKSGQSQGDMQTSSPRGQWQCGLRLRVAKGASPPSRRRPRFAQPKRAIAAMRASALSRRAWEGEGYKQPRASALTHRAWEGEGV